MRSIFIVVHPEASHHTADVVGGWFDSELTERGREQADGVAKGLAATLDGSAEIRHAPVLDSAHKTPLRAAWIALATQSSKSNPSASAAATRLRIRLPSIATPSISSPNASSAAWSSP